MHYPANNFAIDPSKSTIMTNNPDYQWTIGQREELSLKDAKLANQVYCSKLCENYENRCQRGGYPNPKNCNSCLCPSGFSGTYCETVDPSKNVNCGGVQQIQDETHHAIISSPNYPNPYSFDQKCSWLILCPTGQRVKLEFGQDSDVSCDLEKRHCLDYVEVKLGPNFDDTGPRFCCNFWPEKGIYSNQNEMVVIFRSFTNQIKKGFQATLQCV